MHPALHWFRRVIRLRIDAARNADTTFLLAVAALVGILAGLAAILLGMAIRLAQRLLLSAADPSLDALLALPSWQLVLAPTLGGALVGLVTTFLVREAKGHGVPEVIRAVAVGGARIRGRVAVAKTIASALTIGSGGSAGREGPIIQIGAAIGSRLGQALGMTPRRLRTLVACGASAGIAATFNAPMAGAMFSVEVILGDFAPARFGPIVIASVLATAVARAWNGNLPAFAPPPCRLASVSELLPYALLGLLCGLASLFYIRANRELERFFRRGPAARWAAVLRPAAGGALVGLAALASPLVFGDGHLLASTALADTLPLWLLLALALAKTLATSVTLGSGGSGGVFSPAIAIGALLGAAAAHLASPFLSPADFGGTAAYALAGMAGMVAGSMLAPMTAILVVFEISSNYAIILPVMLTAILASVVTARLNRDLSIYTAPLARRGVRLFRNASPDLLRDRFARDHARDDCIPAGPSEPASSLLPRLLASDASQLYVVTPDSRFLGVVTLASARRLLLSRNPALDRVLLAEDIMRTDIPPVYPTDTLSAVLSRFADFPSYDALPLLRSPSDPTLVGSIHYADVLSVYHDEILMADSTSVFSPAAALAPGQSLEIAPNCLVLETPAPPNWLSTPLRDLRIPDTANLRLLLLKRPNPAGRFVASIPTADTRLAPGDRLLLLGTPDAIHRFRDRA